MKSILILILTASMALAATDRYRVHYSIRGSGRDIMVLAENKPEDCNACYTESDFAYDAARGS